MRGTSVTHTQTHTQTIFTRSSAKTIAILAIDNEHDANHHYKLDVTSNKAHHLFQMRKKTQNEQIVRQTT